MNEYFHLSLGFIFVYDHYTVLLHFVGLETGERKVSKENTFNEGGTRNPYYL